MVWAFWYALLYSCLQYLLWFCVSSVSWAMVSVYVYTGVCVYACWMFMIVYACLHVHVWRHLFVCVSVIQFLYVCITVVSCLLVASVWEIKTCHVFIPTQVSVFRYHLLVCVMVEQKFLFLYLVFFLYPVHSPSVTFYLQQVDWWVGVLNPKRALALLSSSRLSDANCSLLVEGGSTLQVPQATVQLAGYGSVVWPDSLSE